MDHKEVIPEVQQQRAIPHPRHHQALQLGVPRKNTPESSHHSMTIFILSYPIQSYVHWKDSKRQRETVDEIQLEVYNIFIEMLTGALKSQLKYSDKSADTIARKLINEGHLYDSSNPQDTDTQHYIEAVREN